MMMHPLCLKKVEEYIQKENDMVRNVILNLCMNTSETLRLSDLEQPYQLQKINYQMIVVLAIWFLITFALIQILKQIIVFHLQMKKDLLLFC